MDWVKLVEETEFAISHLSTNRTSPAVLTLVSRVLHAGSDQAMAAEQVSFQPLVREEPELALLAVQGRAIVNHLGVDFDLMDPLHVIPKLFQVLNVAIADDKVALAPTLAGSRLTRFHGWSRRASL